MRNNSKLAYVFIISLLIFSSFSRGEEIEISIGNNEGTLTGSLMLPNKQTTNQLVIMISGSGPQDRDENVDGFKTFGILANDLSRFGIPSFRFDDRGVGGSSGEFAKTTLADHQKDIDAIIEHFKNSSTYKYNEFILLGHSQGGIVAGKTAVGNADVVKVILMGAPSVPLIDIVLYQLRLELDEQLIDKEAVEAVVSSHNELMWTLFNGKSLSKVRERFIDATLQSFNKLPEMASKSPSERASLAKYKYEEMEYVYNMPSLSSFLFHKSSNDYQKISVPVLSLIGGKDLQVTIEQNKDKLEMALLNSGIEYEQVIYGNANHFFQQAKTGKRDEYKTLPHSFIDGFSEKVANWILGI